MILLLVDDHPMFGVGFVHALTHAREGVQARAVLSLEAALETAWRWPELDLVLIDYRLAGDDGLEGLRRFGARHPLVARVLISGQEDAGLQAQGRGRGLGRNRPKGRSQHRCGGPSPCAQQKGQHAAGLARWGYSDEAVRHGVSPPMSCVYLRISTCSGCWGCGTGMGSMLACNSMPGVFCGLVIDPTDAFLFGQINDGNAMSMPYAKGFGWAAELNLQDCYRKLLENERGAGYPKERA
eukprot:gene15998-33649_t